MLASYGMLHNCSLATFTRFLSTCKRHQKQKEHKFSMEKYGKFVERSVKQTRNDVLQLQNVQHTRQSEENVHKLRGLVRSLSSVQTKTFFFGVIETKLSNLIEERFQ